MGGFSGDFSQHTLLGTPLTPVEASLNTMQGSTPAFDSENIRRASISVPPASRMIVNRLSRPNRSQSRLGSFSPRFSPLSNPGLVPRPDWPSPSFIESSSPAPARRNPSFGLSAPGSPAPQLHRPPEQ